LIVCSDHGHESVEQIIPIEEMLIHKGFKESMDSKDVVVAPNGGGALIYLAAESMSRRAPIASYLLDQEWTEQVYIDDDLNAIGQCPEKGPTIAIDLRHSDKPNPYGIAGYCCVAEDPLGDQKIDCGTHGGLGPYVQRPFLFIRGGGFNNGADISIPVTPMDLAPTILHHLNLPCDNMDGHALQTTRE
jgi:hypothetical protein